MFLKLQAIRFATLLLVCWGTAFLSFLFITSLPIDEAHAKSKKDPAVKFMKRVAKEAMQAVKTGSKQKLESVIRRYADLKGIGMYSLGRYARKLPASNRPNYYRGVAKFMARYFMEQSLKYNVVNAKVQSPSFRENGERLVDTVVYLKGGTAYEVQWRLTRHNKTFKIRDIRILGLWLVPYQRDLFSDFVNKRGGNVNDLVIALHYN